MCNCSGDSVMWISRGRSGSRHITRYPATPTRSFRCILNPIQVPNHFPEGVLSMRFSHYVVCAALLAAAPAFSQTFGEITGEVRDSSGGTIPAARISVTNIDTNATREAFTNDAGVYSVPSFPPALHNPRVEK